MDQSKILIVDDESLNILLYTEMLKQVGYEIYKASDGLDALSQAETVLPDLIVMDWNMPRMSGLEALKAIKKGDKTKEIPVIMITGIMASSESLQTAMNEGAIDFLHKPFDKTEFIARVHNIMLISKSRQALLKKYSEIEDSHNFIHSLLESVPLPLVYYSLDGIVLHCNRQFEKIIGVSAEMLRGKLIYSHCSPNHSELHLNSDMELIKNRQEKAYEGKIEMNNREYIYSKNLFFDSSDTPLGILLIMTDISEIKKMHLELMESKKRELVSSSLRLIHISEIKNHLIAELAKLNAYTNKQGREMIRKIISQNTINDHEIVWKDFEMHFEKVYEVFYQRLYKMFPDLTPGERKLCALLRLNISSKDIAAITFQNPQSVDMARHRLRKKFNLQTDENLFDFLLKID